MASFYCLLNEADELKERRTDPRWRIQDGGHHFILHNFMSSKNMHSENIL